MSMSINNLIGWMMALLLLLLAAGVGWYRYQSDLEMGSISWGERLHEFSVNREVYTPTPLRLPFTDLTRSANIELTVAGVLRETNEERTARGLGALRGSAILGEAAREKLNDMLAKQYFEHVSPSGVGPAQLVDGVGYEYILVGENLALGNFENDAALVQAWMDSPGHRENMLRPRYTELGVAVGQGLFEGQQTWLAVQTFALPLSACPTPNPALQKEFDTKREKYEGLADSLNSSSVESEKLQDKVNALAREINKLSAEGNQKIEEGNSKIEQGNGIIAETDESSEAQSYWDEGKQLQEEGQVLLNQAESKRTEHGKLISKLQVDNQSYNANVEQQQTLNNDLSSLADTINSQIEIFNKCLK